MEIFCTKKSCLIVLGCGLSPISQWTHIHAMKRVTTTVPLVENLRRRLEASCLHKPKLAIILFPARGLHSFLLQIPNPSAVREIQTGQRSKLYSRGERCRGNGWYSTAPCQLGSLYRLDLGCRLQPLSKQRIVWALEKELSLR